jgi:uncharacterized integral membrane protein
MNIFIQNKRKLFQFEFFFLFFKDFPMLVGNLVSIFSGGFIVLIVSLLTRSPLTAEQVEEEWAKTHNIDNPLSPWIQTYKV